MNGPESRIKHWLHLLTNVLATTLLFCASLAGSLVAGEILVRSLAPQSTPSEYHQRFLIDGRPASTLAYFSTDPMLPFVLQPRYKHIVEDRAWYPHPFLVTIDSHGYRNAQTGSGATVAVVGDSVTFGYGVDEPSTFPAQLGVLLQENVYNLGVPGADPSSYMVILERYLRAASPRLILIALAADDMTYLDHTWWKELDSCKPPASRIYRTDVPPSAPAVPPQLVTSFLKYSQLAKFAADFTAGWKALTPKELMLMHRISSRRAIEELNMIRPAFPALRRSIALALQSASPIDRSTCLSPSEEALLARYKAGMRDGRWRSVYAIAGQISATFIAQGCHPIDRDMLRSAVPYFNYYAWYYWKEMDERKTGYILDYEHYLRELKNVPSFQPFAFAIDRIRVKLARFDPSVDVDIDDLDRDMVRAFGDGFRHAPPGCDRFVLFLRRVHELAATHGSQLLMIVLPAEYEFKPLVDSHQMGDKTSCAVAERHGVACMDLSSRLLAYYATADVGLYLDGSHFTREGHALVARWISEWIHAHNQMMKTLSSPHQTDTRTYCR